MAIDPRVLLQQNQVRPDILGAFRQGSEIVGGILDAPLLREKRLAEIDALQNPQAKVPVATPIARLTTRIVDDPNNPGKQIVETGFATARDIGGEFKTGWETIGQSKSLTAQDAAELKIKTNNQIKKNELDATEKSRLENQDIIAKNVAAAAALKKQEEAKAIEAQRAANAASVASDEAEATRLKAVSTEQQKQSTKAFKGSDYAREMSSLTGRAIEALENDANSGFIQDMFPTVKIATAQLEAAKKAMGIKTLNSATFGSLSERELELVLTLEIPNLDEDELLPYLQERQVAFDKMAAEAETRGLFLSEKGNTPAKWRQKVAFDKRQAAKARGKPITGGGAVQSATNGAPSGKKGGTLNTDANGNKAWVFPDGSFEEVK